MEISQSDALERRLRRFHPRHQSAVSVLAHRHTRLADLALSFPALLFALAVPRRRFEPAPIIALVLEGARMPRLAAASGVPLWLRNVPPELFTRPIPALPDSDALRREINNYLPRSPKRSAEWFDAVSMAYAWGNEAVAVWIAREISKNPCTDITRLRCIAVWAWHSLECPDRHDMFACGTRWHAALSFASAREAAVRWTDHLGLYLWFGDEPVADMWVAPGRVDGYEFVPLKTRFDLIEEGRVMNHCVDGYGLRYVLNEARVWSVRRDGERIATVQISQRYRDPMPNIVQITGKNNGKVPADVWWAARRWLQSHDLTAVDCKRGKWSEAHFDARRWRSLWKPYWMAKRGIPEWLPLAPSLEALREI